MTRAKAKTLIWLVDLGISIVFYMLLITLVSMLSLLLGFSHMPWVLIILVFGICESILSATKFLYSKEVEEYIEYLING